MQAQIPATCVAAVIVTDGRVLLGRRAPSRTYYPDCWDLFGGHVEENESLVGALRRELLEELGLEIKSWRPLAVVHDPIEPSVVLGLSTQQVLTKLIEGLPAWGRQSGARAVLPRFEVLLGSRFERHQSLHVLPVPSRAKLVESRGMYWHWTSRCCATNSY